VTTPHDDVSVRVSGEGETHLTLHIGAREVYDAVQMLRADVARAVDTVTGIAATLQDHEDRLRANERTLARIKYGWPVTLVLGLAGTIATALLK